MLGASQLKLAAGGGVSSNYDPIDVSQYTEPEFRAAVDAAENWGTYVAVHAYTPRAIKDRDPRRRPLHRTRAPDGRADRGADRRQRTSGSARSRFSTTNSPSPQPNPGGRGRRRSKCIAGTDAAYRFAKAHKLKTAWGTDILFDPKMTVNQGAMLTTLTRWYEPVEILKMATASTANSWRCRARATLIPASSA